MTDGAAASSHTLNLGWPWEPGISQ